MMGGLAYMTGLTGRPLARRHLGGRHPGRPVRRLRHGADAAAAQAHRQGRAGRERAVRIGGVPDGPASRHHRHERRAAAADARARELVGDLRDLLHQRRPQVFIGITSDGQWKRFCEFFGQPEMAADPTLATNNQRIEARPGWCPSSPKSSSATARTSSSRSAWKPTSPLRRSRGRRTCSITRIF